MARYKLTGQIFFREQLMEAGQEIEFDGEPNSAMEPLDDAAKDAVAALAAKREAKAKALAAGLGASANEGFVAALEKIDARLTAIEERAGIARKDIDEHDAGLQILVGRVDDIEGVIAAASKAPAPRSPKAPAKPADPPADTPPAPDAPASDAPAPTEPPPG